MRIGVVTFGVTAVVLTGILTPILYAQSPKFEVATVKINRSGSSRSVPPGLKNGTLRAENVSLARLLQTANDIQKELITGPAWLDSDRFDLAGKSPQGVPDSEFNSMLQALLKDRFHLEVHRAMKEMAVYEMIVAKEGLKIVPYDPALPDPKVPPPNGGGPRMAGVGRMSQIAAMMTLYSGRIVVDKTGLQGFYSYALSFRSVSSGGTDSPSQDSASPDFFTAIQQQLGLKLEPKKEPIEILVVDHADRVPSEN